MNDMSIRKIKDAKNLSDNSLIYFKGHAKATYMSDGSTVEDAINDIKVNGSGNTDLSNYETKVESQNKFQEAKNYTDTAIANLVDSAPETLNTLNELAVAIQENEDVVEVFNQSIGSKQDKLISGTNIKTINGESILGEGNIVISSGSSSSGGAYALVEHDTNDTTYTLTPNTFHTWGEVGSLTLTFGEEQSGVVNEFLFQFESGETATTLTLPDDLIWANDDIPVIESNYTYQVSILKGFATLMKFKKAVLLEFTIAIYDMFSFNTSRHETYSYKTGMTWEQWVNSEYNTTGNYKIADNECIYKDDSDLVTASAETFIKYQAGYEYDYINKSLFIDNNIGYWID